MLSIDTHWIAGRLANEAWWDGDECTWITQLHGRDHYARSYAPAGAQLYDGTSGIGLALAIYGSVEDSWRAVHTAVGASRFAIGNACRLPMSGGLLGGPLGVGMAVYEAGTMLGNAELIAAARELLGKMWPKPSSRLDFGGGMAGEAFVGAWAATRGLESPSREWIDEAARALSREATADRLADPGLVHGQAGMALGLLAAAELTGEDRYLRLGSHLIEGAAESCHENTTTGKMDQIAWCKGLPGILDVVRMFEQEESANRLSLRLASISYSALNSVSLMLDGTVCHGIAGWLMSLARAGHPTQELEAAMPPFRMLGLGVPPRGSASGLYDGLAGLLAVGTLLQGQRPHDLALLPFRSSA